MDSEVVNELYSIVSKIPEANPAQLRPYLEILREQAPNYGPGAKFVYKRIEGLEGLLS
jgi:hypothetical protein